MMRALLMNAGSSTVKASLVDASGRVISRVTVEWSSFRSREEAVRSALEKIGALTNLPDVVGHRIVHGGELTSSVRITADVRARIRGLADLAPLHNPPGLDTLAAAEAMLPRVPHAAVFDTAFHATIPAAARTYAVPREWTERFGIRRYGFHGLSHAYSAKRAAEILEDDDLRLVICHLGNGCSASAVRGGRSIDTTMGFTPLEGLVMGTRSGSIDPDIVTHLQLRHGLTARDVEDSLNTRSGLLGVSGISGDMRAVHAASVAGDERARLAIDVYTHRVRQAIGALAVTLGGVDALVFTGGVGENEAHVRAASCDGVECLGLEIDEYANARCSPDADIARRGMSARILVIEAREDLAMLAEVVRVIS